MRAPVAISLALEVLARDPRAFGAAPDPMNDAVPAAGEFDDGSRCHRPGRFMATAPQGRP